MSLSLLDDLLWGAGFLAGALVLATLFWRGHWRRFPAFTAWITFITGKTALCYIVYRLQGFSHIYARIYWFGLWPEFVLQLAVVMELARATLRRNRIWIRGARRRFFFAAASGILLSALLSEWIIPPHGLYASWELRGDLFSSLVVCELLVSISLIAGRFRLAWEGRVLALAQGLTALSAVCLVVNALQSYFGTQNFKQIEYFQSYAWIGAMVWIAIEFGRPGTADGFSKREAALESAQGRGEISSRMPGLLSTRGPLACPKFLPRRPGLPRGNHHPLPAANSTEETVG